MHKGYKCLDISTGRVYISRDVIFDENIFPFAELHLNAGTRYSSVVLLLLESSSSWGPSDLPLDNSPTESIPNRVYLWPNNLVQPQKIPGVFPDQGSGTKTQDDPILDRRTGSDTVQTALP
jgi:hypothetical protein